MITCDGCGRELPDFHFLHFEDGERYEHLGLVNVCVRCQFSPRYCVWKGRADVHEELPYPSSTIWFHPRKTGSAGLHSCCRRCIQRRSKLYYSAITPEHRANVRMYNKARNARKVVEWLSMNEEDQKRTINEVFGKLEEYANKRKKSKSG